MRYVFTMIMTVMLLGHSPAKDVEPAKPAPATEQSPDITAETDLVDYMLKSRGLNRQSARLDPETLESLAGQDSMLQPHFLRYWKNPYDFPKFICSHLKDLEKRRAEKDHQGIFEVFAAAQARTGHRSATRFGYVPAMEPDKNTPIISALEELSKECQTTLDDKEKQSLEILAKNIPAELQVRIAKFILAASQSRHYRDRALRNYPKEKLPHTFDYALRNFALNDDKTSGKEFEDGDVINWDLGRALDYDDLYAGAAISLKAIVEIEQLIEPPLSATAVTTVSTPTTVAILDLANTAFEFNTPLGKITFNGKSEDNTYQGEDYLLIIDLAGNDTYNGASAASYKLDHPVSAIIDWSGNDIYAADKDTPCAQGAGILGYGFLIDNGGNDTFSAVNNAQGMCYFGVGILWAEGGDDIFKAHTSAQGAASFGVANLVKTGGNDSYYAYFTSQGFGFAGGYGCLIDSSGNDKYTAEPYDLVHPANHGHDNLRNYSFCQGAGWGQRGDMFGGHSLGGGTGILQDIAGDDSYQCGVYGQATGYWYGTGVLHDKSGNDRYEGSFFVQSGTAHMGMTMLLDETGDDAYHCWRAISQAGAHDVSVNFLVDKAGNDRFSAWGWKDDKDAQTLTDTGKKGRDGGVLAGSAITNSFSMFINLGGDDTYEFYTKDSLGSVGPRNDPGTWRYDNFTIGMFIDVGGTDTYNTVIEPDATPDWPMPKNNSSWFRMTLPGNKEMAFSMGLDIEKGRVPEAEY